MVAGCEPACRHFPAAAGWAHSTPPTSAGASQLMLSWHGGSSVHSKSLPPTPFQRPARRAAWNSWPALVGTRVVI